VSPEYTDYVSIERAVMFVKKSVKAHAHCAQLSVTVMNALVRLKALSLTQLQQCAVNADLTASIVRMPVPESVTTMLVNLVIRTKTIFVFLVRHKTVYGVTTLTTLNVSRVMTDSIWPSKQCVPCGPNCLYCKDAGAGKCDAYACEDGYTDKDNICIPCTTQNCGHCNKTDITKCFECKAGFYLTPSKQCVPCKAANCAYCFGDNTICENCKPGFEVNSSGLCVAA